MAANIWNVQPRAQEGTFINSYISWGPDYASHQNNNDEMVISNQAIIQPRVTYSHLRSADDVYALETTNPITKYGQNAFSHVAPEEWNKLPQDVQLALSIECFKKRLKSYYFIDYYGND